MPELAPVMTAVRIVRQGRANTRPGVIQLQAKQNTGNIW